MAELTLASSQVRALPGDAYRGVRQRFYSLALELCAEPVVAAVLASQFSNFYRSLEEGESIELRVIQTEVRVMISLLLEHEHAERSQSLVLGQRMTLGSSVRLPSRKWRTKIAIPLGVTRSFSKERCQKILDLRSSEELSYEVSSTTAVLSRVREELNIAADIQRSFLIGDHELNHAAQGLDIGATMKPSKEIGGDLYDCISLGSERYLLCVGDVSGKGMPAALTMSTCLTLVRSYSEVIDSPSAIMRRVNQRMCQNNASCAFTTLFLAVINTRSGELRYCNAGHNPTLVLRQDGSIERLNAVHGPALGVVEEMSYGDARLNLYSGETLLIYTDGASEMFNAKHERFGLDAMEASLSSVASESCSVIVAELMQSLLAFAGSEYQHDDITLLAVRLRSGADHPASSSHLSVSIPYQMSGLALVKEKLNDFAFTHQIAKPLLRKTQVVVDELLGNILRYGCADQPDTTTIDLHLELKADYLFLQVLDPGNPFNPLEAQPPDLDQALDDRPIGGLGLHLVKQMTRRICYQRVGNKNQVSMEFALH